MRNTHPRPHHGSTIAITDKHVAADTLVSSGDILYENGARKLHPFIIHDSDTRYVFASCGLIQALPAFMYWFLSQGKAEEYPKFPGHGDNEGYLAGYTVAVITQRRTAAKPQGKRKNNNDIPLWTPPTLRLYCSHTPVPIGMSLPHAVGAGSEVCYGALAAGASAPDALAITCARSASTGAPIEVFSLEEWNFVRTPHSKRTPPPPNVDILTEYANAGYAARCMDSPF
jgi:hypothetical protein